MSKPTHQQIAAVQTVLYDTIRLQRLAELASQLALIMNLDPTVALPPDDARAPAGSGPIWFYPDTQQLDMNVITGAGLCDKIASLLRHIERDLLAVDFPAADKAHLTKALEEEAASWSARAAAWSEPNGALDVATSVSGISAHFSAAVHSISQVNPAYLKTREEAAG